LGIGPRVLPHDLILDHNLPPNQGSALGLGIFMGILPSLQRIVGLTGMIDFLLGKSGSNGGNEDKSRKTADQSYIATHDAASDCRKNVCAPSEV